MAKGGSFQRDVMGRLELSYPGLRKDDDRSRHTRFFGDTAYDLYAPQFLSGKAFWYAADFGLYKNTGKTSVASKTGDAVAVWADILGSFDLNLATGTPIFQANTGVGAPFGVYMTYSQGLRSSNTAAALVSPCTLAVCFKQVSFSDGVSVSVGGLVTQSGGGTDNGIYCKNDGTSAFTEYAYRSSAGQTAYGTSQTVGARVSIFANNFSVDATCPAYYQGTTSKDLLTVSAGWSLSGISVNNARQQTVPQGTNDAVYYEIIGFSRVLNTLEINGLYAYLKAKWKVT